MKRKSRLYFKRFCFSFFFLLRMLVANNNRMPLQTKNPQENRKIFTVREIRLSFFNTLRSIYLHYGTNILAFNWLDQIFLSPKNGFTFQNKKSYFVFARKAMKTICRAMNKISSWLVMKGANANIHDSSFRQPSVGTCAMRSNETSGKLMKNMFNGKWKADKNVKDSQANAVHGVFVCVWWSGCCWIYEMHTICMYTLYKY